jgi:hypothetical protein
MKVIFTYFSLFLCSSYLFSQTEFMPIGFRYVSYSLGFFSSSKRLTISEKDTVINGELLRKLVHKYSDINSSLLQSIQINYIKQKGDSIFQFNTNTNMFTFLFKNKFNLGDSVYINCSSSSKPKIVVDSIATINGMKRYKMVAEIVRSGMKFKEIYYLYDAFGPNMEWELRTFCYYGYYDGAEVIPLCYRTNETANPESIIIISKLKPVYDCNIIMSSTELQIKDLNIKPNPAQTMLQIEWGVESPIRDIQLISLQGKILKTYFVDGKNTLDINVEGIQNGLYFLQMNTKERQTLTRKITVLH